jgi:predicted 3-demethylubiquinone-9 3-methyltransferase (glyoxalase superfamily)
MQAIVTHLAFARNAEEAVDTYVRLFESVFGSSRILATTYYGAEELQALRDVPDMSEDIMPGPAGSVKMIRFALNGREFIAINGGGYFGKFNESASLYVTCETQAQIDALWATLAAGGEEQPCGWVRDRFGVSWQIAPRVMLEIEEGADLARCRRATRALYGMTKIDIEGILRA